MPRRTDLQNKELEQLIFSKVWYDIPTKHTYQNTAKDIESILVPEIVADYIDLLESISKTFGVYPEVQINDDLIGLSTIIHKDFKYWYEYKLATNGDTCLATKRPEEYCNGVYVYSSKDPGTGKAFVVMHTRKIKN